MKNTKLKKILASLLTMCMLFSLVSVNVMAAGDTVEFSFNGSSAPPTLELSPTTTATALAVTVKTEGNASTKLQFAIASGAAVSPSANKFVLSDASTSPTQSTSSSALVATANLTNGDGSNTSGSAIGTVYLHVKSGETLVAGDQVQIDVSNADGTNGETTSKYAITVKITAVTDIKVTSIKVTSTSSTMLVNETRKLELEVLPANATNKVVTWSSSDNAVATVDASGNVTAVAPGPATIRATATDNSGNYGAYTIEVTDQAIPLTGISLNTDTMTLAPNASGSLTVTLNPVNTTTVPNLTWSSSDTSVATVATSSALTANVTAVATGSALITVRGANSTSATCTVTVTETGTIAVQSVALSPDTQTLTVGEVKDLVPIFTPQEPTNKGVTWSTSAPEIVSVTAAGQIKALTPGSAVITVTTVDGAKTATCNVTVNAAVVPVTGVTLNKSVTTLTVGRIDKLTATIAPQDATNKDITWKSDNAGIAKVDLEGNVTAIAVGTTKITVTTADGGYTAVCDVTVNANTGTGSGSSDSSSGSSGSGSGGNPSTPSTPSTTVSTTQTDKTIDDALKAGKAPAITLSGNVTVAAIKGNALKSVSEKGQPLTLSKGDLKMTLPVELIKSLNLTDSAIIEINIVPVQPKVTDAILATNPANKELLSKSFDITLTDNGKAITSFSAPITLSIDVSSVKLSNADKAKLTGVRILGNGKVNQLGAKVNNNVAEFQTSKLSEYGVIVSDNLVKLETAIGKTSYSVNGKSKTTDVAPVIIGDYTMVPVRFIAESLGADVSWTESTKTVSIKLDGQSMTMKVGQKASGMDVAPTIVDGRTLVPLRYIAETLDANVIWNASSRSIDIYR